MKTMVMLLMAVMIGLGASQPGIAGSLTAYQGGKTYSGWVDDKGRVVITNAYGKPLMSGWLNKYGGITINDERTKNYYQGRVSGFGNCILHSNTGGPSLRLEIER
jgi:hypothetical protein